MAPHSSTLAWKIPWTDEPGGLQSMGSLRVGHDWVTSLSLFTFMHWRRKWQPTPSVLAWRIPGTEEPGRRPSMGLHRVRHDWGDLTAVAAGTLLTQLAIRKWLIQWRSKKVFGVFICCVWAFFSLSFTIWQIEWVIQLFLFSAYIILWFLIWTTDS